MSYSELGRFISGQRSGTYDSHGEFTLDPTKAHAKLGECQLANPSLWALKLAQAGVSLGADSIAYTLQYSRTTIRFFQTFPVSAGDLAQALFDGELPSEDWKRHLIAGLRAFCGQSPRSLSWQDAEGLRVTVKGRGLALTRESAAPDASGATLTVVADLEPFPRGLYRLNHAVRQTMAEHRTLCDRLQLCHVPVTVDGRLVSQQFPPLPGPGAAGRSSHGLRRAFAVAVLGEGDLPVVFGTLASPLLRLEACQLPLDSGSIHRVRGFAVAKIGLSHAVSQCYMMKHGTWMEPLRLDFYGQGTALDLFLDAGDSKTDLSEFRLRDDEPHVEELRKPLLEWIEAKGLEFGPDVATKLSYGVRHLKLLR